MALQLSQLWDEEKETILTQMWDERPFLYDHNVTGFNNRAKKDQAYREIAYAVGIPVGNVMKRMVSLRTQYSRAKNKGFRDDKPPSRKKRWLLDHLAFLGPFIETRNANGTSDFPKAEGFEDDDNLVDHDMEFETTVLPPRVQFKKREFNPNKRKLEIEEGVDEDFSEELDMYQDHVKVSDGSIDCSSPQIATTKYTEYPVRKDQEQLFCDFLAGELREIVDPIAKAKLINKIQNEVFAFKIAELYKAKEGKGSTEGCSGDQPVPCQLNATVNCTNNNLLNTSNSAGTSSGLLGVAGNDSY